MCTCLSFKYILQRYKVAFCIAIVSTCVYLSCFWAIILGNDSPIKVEDKNHQSSNKKISLEEAIHIAIEKNPQLESTRDQVDAATGSLKQSRLYPNPVLELLAEEIPTREIGLNRSQHLVAITQPIITGGKRSLGIRVSEKSKEKNELERDAVLLNVIADTKKAFYKVAADQEAFVIAKKIEKIARDIYGSEKGRFDAG